MKWLIPVVLMLSGCTWIVTTEPLPYTTVKPTQRQCGLFTPLEREPEAAMEGLVLDLDAAKSNDQVVEIFYEHVKKLHAYIEEGRQLRTIHYQDYLRRCAYE